MHQARHSSFDFDQWAELAQHDPQGFEARRSEAIEAAIRQASPRTQERLRRLQWKLDQIRRTSGTPLAACIRMHNMMLDSLHGRGGLLETLQRDPRQGLPRQTNNVVQFGGL
jgi:hypothetical protein